MNIRADSRDEGAASLAVASPARRCYGGQAIRGLVVSRHFHTPPRRASLAVGFVPMLMVAKLYAGALVESPDVPHVGWRVGAYVGRSCAVMPSLAYGTSDMPDSAALADAAPYVDDPAMRCFASRLRRREPLRIAVFGTSVVAGNRCNKQNGANFPQVLHHLPTFPPTHLPTYPPTYPPSYPATYQRRS